MCIIKICDIYLICIATQLRERRVNIIKFLLIDIGYDCEELNEPLGIEVLASYLNACVPQVETKTYCANFDVVDYSYLLNQETPDIIGISTHINTWERFNKLYCECLVYYASKSIEPIIIVGGVLATYGYQKLIKNYKNVICSIGEGEESLSILLRIVSSLKDIDYHKLLIELKKQQCPNLIFFNSIGEMVSTKRSCLNDLQHIDIKVDHKYIDSVIKNNGIVRMEASRGCPWNKCSFCVLKWKYAGLAWRPYSIEKIICEIIDLSAKGAQTIYFTDEEFIAGDFHRINTIVKEIKEAKEKRLIKSNLEFIVSTSVQALIGKYGIQENELIKLLKDMKAIGFRSFFLGIESGSNTQLKRFCKGVSVEECETVLKLIKNCGIEIDVGYILFDPLVTLDELEENLKFLKRNHLDEQISRFAKRLRLVPHTVYCSYKNLLIEEYDENNIEYVYKFFDANVEKVYEIYYKWELKHLQITHTLQAEIRVASSSAERNKKITLLEEIRKKEFLILEYLVVIAKKHPSILDLIVEKTTKEDFSWTEKLQL